jgi:peptidoglycan/xylan/chitin deacetylase (PgdA/CDA1 family)
MNDDRARFEHETVFASEPMLRRWTPVWPGDYTCAVMLSFDVDGLTLWIDRGTTPDPAAVGRAVSLGNYGPVTAMPRILSMLERLDIPATFFVPAFVAENWPEPLRQAVDHGHEIGIHGYMHEVFHGLSDREQVDILDRAQSTFGRVLGTTATGFRAPSGDWAPSTPRLLSEFGLSYSSSYRGDDRPYQWIFQRSNPLVEIPGHWELDDFPQFGYNDSPPSPSSQDRPSSIHTTFENWQWEFDGYAREGLSWVLMTHPQVIGTPARLAALEQMLRGFKIRGDVWFATGRQIAEWVTADLGTVESA